MPKSGQTKPSRHFLESIVLALAVLYTVSLVAQHAQGPTPPKYDAQAETKMKGTVDDVRLPSSAKEIVYLLIKTGSDTTVEVYVCPKSFLDDMGVTFSKGDQIAITGSQVKQGNGSVILAREIVKGADTLVFRDDKGKPVWS